jgi:hypothetical protein
MQLRTHLPLAGISLVEWGCPMATRISGPQGSTRAVSGHYRTQPSLATWWAPPELALPRPGDVRALVSLLNDGCLE